MVDPDLELLNATGRGEHESFELLVKRYQGPLLNFITRYVGDRFMAEDIAQEVFIRIYRAAPRFEARTKVSTWIFHIAYNQAMTEMGRRKRRQELRDAVGRSGEGEEEAVAGPAERIELEEEITPALGRLPESQRAALLLRVNEELSYREIGEVLGVSVQSVESLLFRARTSLKRYLRKK
jgi:RNA polymerase sigma-70 factor (ECF subfamily)